MNDMEKWREKVRDIRAGGATWWWWWYICSRVCLSTVGFASHMRSYDGKQSQADLTKVLLQFRRNSHRLFDKVSNVKHVWKGMWECTGSMSTPKTHFLLLVTDEFGLSSHRRSHACFLRDWEEVAITYVFV